MLMQSNASAIFVDGKGHYSLRGETRTAPEFGGGGNYRTIEQFFRLDTEIRVDDEASFFAEFRLFDNPRSAFLGDDGRPDQCSSGPESNDATPNIGNAEDCSSRPNDPLNPRYEPYTPKITKAYARYATEYCLLTVGRRGRDWGLGMYLDSGRGFFDTDASVFDGVTCDVNLQKSQTLAFSIGYDKITETGRSAVLNAPDDVLFGGTNNSDDVDQIFFTIEYNDHQAKAGKGFSQQIGIYFANIFSGDNQETDIKIADLYLNLLISDLVIQQEVLFRLGKTADPSIARLGGLPTVLSDESRISNDVQSIAAAGAIEYFLSRSGSYKGPERYEQGTAKSHSLFLSYAYAPGDSDGYYSPYPADTGSESDRLRLANDSAKKASAVAMHSNFKPALLLFNGQPQADRLRIDGVFDPYRLMNVSLFSFGYRYRSLENGNFEAKLVTASLNESIPGAAKELYQNDSEKPIGYEGKSLGWELDLTYSMSFGSNFELGTAAAVGLPGDAWDIKADEDPKENFLIQAYSVFKF